MKTITALFLLLGLGSTALAQNSLYLTLGSLHVHHAVFSPESPIGDVLYLHGYGDSFSNHRPLFENLNEKGFRVIALDYPSHGSSYGELWDDLDHHSFDSLTRIAATVLKQYRTDLSRPLIIAGWSTGGLHAVRIAQNPDWRQLFPGLRGLILYAPGVSVKKCVGNQLCHISNETLTHDPALQHRSIHPRSPLYRLDFATKIVFNSWLTWRQGLPADITTLLIVGADDDRYVQSVNIKKWVQLQRTEFNADITSVQCPGARHELDNELPEYGGSFVRTQSGLFAESMVRNRTHVPISLEGSCEQF